MRKYPKKYEKIIITLCKNLDLLTMNPKAKASMIWIIGEYAEIIVDAHNYLKQFIDSFEEEPVNIKLQLLTSTVKLYFKKPDKSKELIQKVLNLAIDESYNNSLDVRDRGYVYLRLLSINPIVARKVILVKTPILSMPILSMQTAFLPKHNLLLLLDNLSTLSSVYHYDYSYHENKSISFEFYENDYNDTSQLKMVINSNKGNGIEISVGFSRKDNEIPTMIVKCVNKSNNNIIKGIDFKFNKNYLGIEPMKALPLTNDIEPGQSQIINIRLKLSKGALPLKSELTLNTELDFNVEMAVRLITINKSHQSPNPAKIVLFASQINPQIFFENTDKSMVVDKNLFVSKWKSISTNNQQQIIFDKPKDKTVENIKNIFKDNSFVFIHKRHVSNRGISLYFSTILKSVNILLELSIANNGKCRIITRSQSKYLSYIVCNCGVILIKKKNF